MTLLKTTRAEDQDHDLFCECHGEAPVQRLFKIKDEHGVFSACLVTFLSIKGQDHICQAENCLNAAEDELCAECHQARGEAAMEARAS